MPPSFIIETLCDADKATKEHHRFKQLGIRMLNFIPLHLMSEKLLHTTIIIY